MDGRGTAQSYPAASFDISGVVEVAYALLAFMFGVALGTLIRGPAGP
ncbi:MAG: hypothetical protein ABSG36_09845 [Acidimicrobiales bacterium]